MQLEGLKTDYALKDQINGKEFYGHFYKAKVKTNKG